MDPEVYILFCSTFSYSEKVFFKQKYRKAYTLTMLKYNDPILQSIGEAVVVLDPDGFIRFANQAITAFTGYSPTELIKKSLSVLSAEDDSLRTEYELSVALREGRFSIEGWRRRKDGSLFWGELSIYPVLGETGAHNGYICLIKDRTAKKEDELRLRKNEEMHRLMVHGIKDYAIFMLDTKGNIMSWNEGARQIKGYLSSEIIGQNFSVFYTAGDVMEEKPLHELKVAKETGKFEEEGWRVKKNGSAFWASVVINALYNEFNEFIGYSKITRDLTDKKIAEESLRQSEERYRLLVAQVTDYAIFMLDIEGRIMSWNEGARRIKGYTEQEIVGKYFSIFYPEEDKIANKPAMELRHASKTGKYEEEGWRLRKDGTRFWASVVITAVYNQQKKLAGYSKVTRDLTERKHAERALRDSYQRYREMADALRITNDELSHANKELEQFTSIVSHDLQEPIRTIKSFLQLIELKLNESESSELRSYIAKASTAGNRMKELIQNLLNYSQLSKNEVLSTEVSVDDLINEALQNLRTAIDSTAPKITIEKEVETVYGDRVQLVQLVQNLLSNALKFTDTGQPVVKIRVARENGEVKFSISDNGIGIQQNDMTKIFEIFRRLHTKKEYPGTGIGLAICKKIVDRHHGRIWPESQPGKGSTFHFTINTEQEVMA